MRVLWLVVGGAACAPDMNVDALEVVDDPAETVGVAEWAGDRERSFGLESGVVLPEGGGDDGPLLVADSVSGFSDQQGRDGWFYGYLEPDVDNTFLPMDTYNGGGADPGWYAATGGVFWTMIDAESMHPNGETTTQGRTPREQWAVRRWVSDVEGTVQLTGQFAKISVDGDSNGVAAYVFVDGEMRWAWFLEGWDNTGVAWEKAVDVRAGSTVDFVLDAWQSDDRSDRSLFTAQVWL